MGMVNIYLHLELSHYLLCWLGAFCWRGLAYGSPDAPVGMRLQNGGRAESFLPIVDPQCKTLLAQGLGWLLLVSFKYVVCLLGYAFRLSSLASMVHLGIYRQLYTFICRFPFPVSRFPFFVFRLSKLS